MEISSGHSRAVESIGFFFWKKKRMLKEVVFAETVKYCRTLTNIDSKSWKTIGLLKRITFQTSRFKTYVHYKHMNIGIVLPVEG